MSKKALFIDRDGVINRLAMQDSGVLDSPQNENQVKLMDGIVPIIKWANDNNIPVIEISNQPGIAKGKLTLERSEAIENKVHSLLNEKGAHIDAKYRCFHHPNAIIDTYKIECDCRKPKSGLLLQASKELHINLAESFFLGDNITDAEAGYIAGCSTILFLHTPHPNDTPEKLAENKAYNSSHHITSLYQVVPLLSKAWNITSPVKAVIVAGGKGERLRPLTETIPKPMLEIGGKPILLHTIELLKKHGINHFIIALCYLPDVVTNYFGDGSNFGVNITYTFEDPQQPLGTAGAISPARDFINNTFIVTYADILRHTDIEKMLKEHNKRKNLASIHVYRHQGNTFKSSLTFNQENRLLSFIEMDKKEVRNNNEEVWSNGSFYIFEPEIFNQLEEDKHIDFAKNIFQNLLKNDIAISVFPTEDYFIDIGTKDKLEQAIADYNAKNPQG